MPLTDDEIEQYKQNQDQQQRSNKSKAIRFLENNKGKWYYIAEIQEETGLAQSSVSTAIENHKDQLEIEENLEVEGKQRKYVKYPEVND